MKVRLFAAPWTNPELTEEAKEAKSMRNKKRILLILGVILFFGAAVAFGISRWVTVKSSA